MAKLAHTQRQMHSPMVTGSIPVSAKLFHKPLVWMFGDICNLSYWEDDGICASGLTCHKVHACSLHRDRSMEMCLETLGVCKTGSISWFLGVSKSAGAGVLAP